MLTILPPCSSIAGSIRVAAESPQPFERSNIIQANQAAVANHVGMDDGDQLPPIRRSSTQVVIPDIIREDPPYASPQ